MKSLLLSVVMITNTLPSTPVIELENVASIQVVGNWPGEQGSTYTSADHQGKETITKVVRWINEARPVSGPAEFGKYPMLIKVRTNDGGLIIISQAHKWVHGTMTDGRGYSNASPIKNEIVIRWGSQLIRAKSPEIYDWLDAQPVRESPLDPYVEPRTNADLMNEVLLFELRSRIDEAVKEKFGEVLSASYEINGIRADGHGGFSVRIHGRISHGAAADEVNLYFESPHFNSGLVLSRIDVLNKK